MGYFLVDRFGGGVDTRRSEVAAPGGTMREIHNAFVNKGGEIEKRKKWGKVEELSNLLADVSPGSTANKMDSHGPLPTFDLDAVLFLVNATTSGGNFVSDGGGYTLTVGRFTFGTFAHGTSLGTGAQGVNSSALYADEILYSFTFEFDVHETYIGQYLLTYTAGDICPTSKATVSGRSGTIGGTGSAAVNLVGRFLSSINVSPNDFLLIKSDTGAPEADGGTGAGQIETRGQGIDIGRPFAIQHYYSQVAVFGEKGVQFWNVDADAANFSYARGIAGEALVGRRTPLPYADGDVLYLTRNGIRSLRARDSSNFAQVTDIGSPIDSDVSAVLAFEEAVGRAALSVTHREAGQAWVIVGTKIYVLSRYPSADVSGWSTFDVPTIDDDLIDLNLQLGPGADMNQFIMDACPISETVCVRMGTDEVFVYGGTSALSAGDQYDASEARIVTPYFTMGDPYAEKHFTGFDLSADGAWGVEYSLDSENEAWVSVGTITGNSHMQGQIPLDVTSAMIALRFTSTSASAAKISQFGIHFQKTEVND